MTEIVYIHEAPHQTHTHTHTVCAYLFTSVQALRGAGLKASCETVGQNILCQTYNTHTHTHTHRERNTGAHGNDVQGSIKGHTTLKAGDDGVCLQGEGPLWACPGFESFLTVVNHHPPTGASWWWVYKTHWHLWPETDLTFKLTCSAFLKRPPYKHQAEPAT